MATPGPGVELATLGHTIEFGCPGASGISPKISVLDAFDEVAQKEANRLFPGLAQQSHEQVSMAVGYGGLGRRRASVPARRGDFAGLIMVTSKARSLLADAVRAGLLPAGAVEQRSEEKTMRIGRARGQEFSVFHQYIIGICGKALGRDRAWQSRRIVRNTLGRHQLQWDWWCSATMISNGFG